MTLTPADIRNATLLSVATIAAGFMMPVIPYVYVGLPLAAFALGWIAYRFGTAPASGLAIVASLPVALFPGVMGVTSLDAAFVAVALLAIGPGTAWALRRFAAFTVAGGVTLLIAAAFLVAPIGADTLHVSLETWRQLLSAVAASGSVADAAGLRASIGPLLTQMSMTWPATAVYTMGIGVLLGVPLVSRAGRSLGQQVSRYPALPDLDLSFHLVWPAIAGLALVAAGTVWGHGQGLIHAVGANVLMIVRPALLLQGLAVFAALYRKVGIGRFMRTLGFVLLAVTELLIPSVSILGVADLFFNLRKRQRGQHGTAPQPL
jgi:uncharacterized protein YybS (DUF2232 family)